MIDITEKYLQDLKIMHQKQAEKDTISASIKNIISDNDVPLTYLTVKQAVIKYPFLTEGGLRHLIFFKDSNGFNKVIRKLGTRVLIKESALLEYIDNCKD